MKRAKAFSAVKSQHFKASYKSQLTKSSASGEAKAVHIFPFTIMANRYRSETCLEDVSLSPVVECNQSKLNEAGVEIPPSRC